MNVVFILIQYFRWPRKQKSIKSHLLLLLCFVSLDSQYRLAASSCLCWKSKGNNVFNDVGVCFIYDHTTLKYNFEFEISHKTCERKLFSSFLLYLQNFIKLYRVRTCIFAFRLHTQYSSEKRIPLKFENIFRKMKHLHNLNYSSSFHLLFKIWIDGCN